MELKPTADIFLLGALYQELMQDHHADNLTSGKTVPIPEGQKRVAVDI